MHIHITNLNIMVSLSKFTCVYTLIFLINPIFCQQFYDRSHCTAVDQVPGSNYLCNSQKSRCRTFIVYRVQKSFTTISSIASLFNSSITKLLNTNKITQADSTSLQLGREILIPITCSCLDRFSQAIFTHISSPSDSLSTIACEVFEGLVKAQILMEKNHGSGGDGSNNFEIKVPVRCACPDKLGKSRGVKFLVTYPIIRNDHVDLIATKFGVPEEMIWDANNLAPYAAIFPQTTILIPILNKDVPVVNWDIEGFSGYPVPGPRSPIPLNNIVPGTKSNSTSSYVLLGGGVSAAIVLIVLAFVLFVSSRKKKHPQSFQPLSAGSSRLSNFSRDFLDGMSKLKHSLVNFSLEEIRIATEDFSEASEIGTAVYRGKIGGSKWAIEQMNSEEAAHHVIDILTKISHLNVVKLEGCCHESRPYLVFEYAENGSLRDCLSNGKMARQLIWTKRMQIAFDLAVGLHYIHYCTKPAYVHRNINSKNVLITKDWRAKISGFRLAKPLICIEEKGEDNWNESVIVGRKGYLAPEYLIYGLASPKVDIFAFGVVLLELLSGKEAITEGNLLKDSIKFLADGGIEDSSECLDKLKGFMDPILEGDYPFGDAMCLVLLARCCVDEDPQHRPTMNDVLKTLSRML